MSKQQMIEAIRQCNRSVPADYLVHFNDVELDRYLRRLTQLQGQRGRQSVWVRESESPAVVARYQ